VAAALERPAKARASFGVWPDNWPVAAAFVAVQTQWRTGLVATGRGFRTAVLGLDYAGALAGLRAAGIEVSPELWAGLQVMERAAAAALNGD